jgi:hypothetical protein
MISLEPGESKTNTFETSDFYFTGEGMENCLGVRAAPVRLGGNLLPEAEGW